MSMHAYIPPPKLQYMAAGLDAVQNVNGKIRQERFPVYVAITHSDLDSETTFILLPPHHKHPNSSTNNPTLLDLASSDLLIPSHNVCTTRDAPIILLLSITFLFLQYFLIL